MNSNENTARLLGFAFLLQATASAVGGLVLLEPLIVPGNIVDTMTNIANNALQVRASIVLEMITAIGIVMLGVLMYLILRKQNKNIAIVAMGRVFNPFCRLLIKIGNPKNNTFGV